MQSRAGFLVSRAKCLFLQKLYYWPFLQRATYLPIPLRIFASANLSVSYRNCYVTQNAHAVTGTLYGSESEGKFMLLNFICLSSSVLLTKETNSAVVSFGPFILRLNPRLQQSQYDGSSICFVNLDLRKLSSCTSKARAVNETSFGNA